MLTTGSDKGYLKGKGKGKSNKGKGSRAKTGWLNKMIPLLAAIMDEKHDDIAALVDEYSRHPSVVPLLEKFRDHVGHDSPIQCWWPPPSHRRSRWVYDAR